MSVAWSHSVLDSFETCEYRHYRTKVKKDVTEPQSDEMRHGNRVHKALEDRLLGKAGLPKDLSHYEGFATSVLTTAVGGQLFAEQKLALNARFEPRKFFDKDVWVRSITDFTIIKPIAGSNHSKAFIGDWKTGNPKPNSAQLKLSAVVTFANFPSVSRIMNSFVWIKTGEVTKETFHREDAPALWQEFMPKVQRLEIAMAENKWTKRPSGLCRKWCPVRDCEYHGR